MRSQWEPAPIQSGNGQSSQPNQRDIAASFAVKSAILVAITMVIMALWAVTSHPTAADATLGTPIVGEQELAVNQAAQEGFGD